MGKERFYPKDFEATIFKYATADQSKIRSEYNKIYDTKIAGIIREVQIEYKDQLKNHKKHEELRNFALRPFLLKDVKNFELISVEPLKFMKIQGEIDENTPIFDFLIGQFTEEEHNLIRLIFGEVKGQTPRDLADFKEFIKNYDEKQLRDIIFQNIKRQTGKEFNSEKIDFEYVLIVHELRIDQFVESIRDSGLPFKIWKLVLDWYENEFRIEIVDPFDDSGKQEKLDGAFKRLQKRNFEMSAPFEFTFIADPNFILRSVISKYLLQFDAEIIDENLTLLIENLGWKEFYDDARIVEYVIGKIKEWGKKLDLIKFENDRMFFLRVDVEGRILESRLKKRIDRDGMEFLKQVLEIVQPEEKPPERKTDQMLKRKIDKRTQKKLFDNDHEDEDENDADKPPDPEK